MGCLGRKLCKFEDLRLIPRTHLEKAVVAASVWNPSTRRWTQADAQGFLTRQPHVISELRFPPNHEPKYVLFLSAPASICLSQ